jgi:hypothetical protein
MQKILKYRFKDCSWGRKRRNSKTSEKNKNLLFFFRIVQYLFLLFLQPLNWKFTLKYRLSRLVYSCCERRASSRIKSIVTSSQVILAATRKGRKHSSAQLVLRTWLACCKVRFGSLKFLYVSDWHVAFFTHY